SCKDPRKKVGPGYQIDIMGSLFLEIQKDPGQLFRRNLFTQSFLADLVILTVTAFQRAAGKEYSSASSGAADTWLLPVVESSAGTSYPILFSAESGSFLAVYSTVP